jgi:acyl-CoA thioester hydrolase
VLFDDIDGMRHVNNAVYADYLNECSQQVVAAHGWPWQRMVKEGFGIYIRRLQIQYLQPALLDDELEIATWAFDMRRATAARHYTIQRVSDEGLLCQAQVFAAWIDLANGKPIRIPEDFLNDFFPNIVR